MRRIKDLSPEEYQQWKIDKKLQKVVIRKKYEHKKKLKDMRTEREQLKEWADIRIDTEYGDQGSCLGNGTI